MSSSLKQSSGYSSYSPISTLERQYTQQRLLLFCRGNASCCVSGGVETVLKLGSPQPARKTVGGSNNVDDNVYNNTTLVETSEQGGDDPFSFLNEAPPPEVQSNNKKSIGNKFMQSIKKTTKNIERGMQTMAIKADKGRNPDWYVLGVYDTRNTLLNMTDSVHPVENGLNFVIPMVLPLDDENAPYTLKLWIRSGATLLKQTKANKNYLVASTTVTRASLMQVVNASGGTHGFTSLPLESHVVVGAGLQCCIATDLKLPVLCGLGWSLTDPDARTYHGAGLHNLPLDQSYGYISSSAAHWLIATERSIESTVVLPLATAYASLAKDASQISLQHASSVSSKLLANRHDSMEGHNAHVHVGVGYLQVQSLQAITASLSINWQRPDCIFEVELLPPATKVPVHTSPITFSEASTVPLHAKVCTVGKDFILPSVLARVQSQQIVLGTLRFQMSIVHAGRSQADGSVQQLQESWTALLPLERFLSNTTTPDHVVSIPVHHSETRAAMGSLVCKIIVGRDDANHASSSIVGSQGGLVSLVGLDTLLEDSGVEPVLDYDTVPSPSSPNSKDDATHRLRMSQLQTMGNFVTHAHLQSHVANVRTKDVSAIQERLDGYTAALRAATQPQGEERTPSHQDKTPKPFRPSSSRMEPILAGIGFNIHVQSLALSIFQNQTPQEGALFHNVTCGAPADHARGFGNYLGEGNTAVGTIRGGLRRLEAKRIDLAKALVEAQSNLIAAVGQHLSVSKQSHISARHAEISAKRWKVFEVTQHLTSLTWMCAVRRANVFSQALGIAVTSYLTSLADVSKLKQGWPDLWVKHGYLVTYEGLLSAAGKELGMIEDASVGISMLRMVHVVLVCDDKTSNTSTMGAKVAVPNSPYLRWVQISYTGKGSYTLYRLEIGIDPLYYAQRIPEPLRNGASVQFYPLLYQVGVDIRQWGAHASMNAKQNLAREESDVVNGVEESTSSGMIDDEDDDVGVPDNDVLIQLNVEACRKMNTYAHMISPVEPNNQQQQIHPLIVSLHGQVMSSAGKMVHGIVDEAATVAQRLGGGGVVFCKSGKDRTAMQVTYKQSQFVNRFLQNSTQEGVFENATLMRVYGTRLPICEKNVGQAKFAFNSLQVRFMPDMLKPPPSTLAGFLKGGKVFSREGGIES